jgi:L-ascorbate metabolism protein UlaG (beta-lactamase superfamily)
MTLTYIFHSGFVLETEMSILIFDYWLDLNGVVPPFLKKDKPIYVFSSHFHEDHFNSMKEFTAEKGIPFWEISSEGETITLE